MASEAVKTERIRRRAKNDELLANLATDALKSGKDVAVAALANPLMSMLLLVILTDQAVRHDIITNTEGVLITGVGLSTAALGAFRPVQVGN